MNMLRKAGKKKRFWFTLVELVVVITVLAILATIGFLALSGYSQDAKESSLKANVRSLHTAISSEAAMNGRSPRYFISHDDEAALSWGLAYVDGNPVTLTWGDWDEPGTNYSAGNPDYVKLKLNPEKFRSAANVPALFQGIYQSRAAYDSKLLTVGAFDWTASSPSDGKKRSWSYFQVAGVAPATGVASVTWNFPSSSGSVSWLVRNPSSDSSTGALLDWVVVGATTRTPTNPVSLSLSHSPNNKSFTVSWSAGSLNGGVGGCRIEVQIGASSVWTPVSSPATVNCDAATSSQAVTIGSSSPWVAGFQTKSVRIVRVSDSAVVWTFPQNLTCSATISSSAPTPNVDEDCNGAWDNTASAAVNTVCASEGGVCYFTGTKVVTYYCPGGNSTSWTFTSSVSCSNSTFGDPHNGCVKSCRYPSTTTVYN